MKSAIIKHSVVINGHKTSVSLEQPFWSVVREIANGEGTTVSAVLRRVDASRSQANLSSAVRVYVLQHVRALVAAHEAATLPAPLHADIGAVSPAPPMQPMRPRA